VFSSEVEAARVYDEAARQLYGEFSRPNIPEPETRKLTTLLRRYRVRERIAMARRKFQRRQVGAA
jgi:hypothetical protein